MVRFTEKSLICSTVLLALLFVGCGDIGNEGKNSALTFDDVKSYVTQEPTIGFDSASTNQQILATSINAGLAPSNPNYKVAFGIKSYKIIYTTTDDKGLDVNASGLVTIPIPTEAFLNALKAQGRTYSMSIISDQHGTIFEDKDAPTTSVGGLPAFMGVIQANQIPSSTPLPFLMSAVGGFITVQPDYIGYGASKGSHSHPYLLEKSSASATVDLIKAVVKFANDSNLPFNGQVFLSGYSEGGYVTMATAKEIEANHPYINLMGIAPMAGPYDLNATAMGVISQPTMGRPDFIGGIINSYASVYDFNLTDILNEPYATILPELYTGETSSEDIRGELDENVSKFFVPTYRYDFLTNQNNNLRKAFVENTPLDWSPKTKVKLLHCTNDEVISSQLSQIAYAKLSENNNTNVELELIDEILDGTPPSVHVVCGTKTYPIAIDWFNKIRTGEIK
jgi:pimeloyl-ACP methyl ester carboxylesterase